MEKLRTVFRRYSSLFTCVHHFHRAARQTKSHGPKGATSTPIDQIVNFGHNVLYKNCPIFYFLVNRISLVPTLFRAVAFPDKRSVTLDCGFSSLRARELDRKLRENGWIAWERFRSIEARLSSYSFIAADSLSGRLRHFIKPLNLIGGKPQKKPTTSAIANYRVIFVHVNGNACEAFWRKIAFLLFILASQRSIIYVSFTINIWKFSN